VNFAAEQASISYDPDRLSIARIKKAVTDSGYRIPAVKKEYPLPQLSD